MLVAVNVVVNITHFFTIPIAKLSRRRQHQLTPNLPPLSQRLLNFSESCVTCGNKTVHTLAMLADGSQAVLCSESIICRLDVSAKPSAKTLPISSDPASHLYENDYKNLSDVIE